MGIELPAELRAVAERTGVRWPEADEDAMRDAAVAWREAAKSIDALARDADTTRQGALAAVEGEAAQAARAEWDRFSAEECTAAADRLEHAAEQIGAAKVRMVRELVVLAENTDAAENTDVAENTDAVGEPQALAGLDTALRGAADALAQVHDTVRSAVAMDSGVTVEAGAVSGSSGCVREPLDAAAGSSTRDSAGEVAGTVERPVQDVRTGTGQVPSEVVGGAAGKASDVADQVGELPGTAGIQPDRSGGAVTDEPPWRGDAEHTGPVSVDISSGGGKPELAAEGTGPIPVVGDSPSPGGGENSGAQNASITAPQAVHQMWAPQPSAPGSAPVFGPAPGGPYVPPPVAGPRPPAFPPHQPPPAQQPPAAGRTPATAFGAAGPPPPAQQPPAAGRTPATAFGAAGPPPPAQQPMRNTPPLGQQPAPRPHPPRGPMRPGPPQPPAPPQPHSSPTGSAPPPPRRASRAPAVVAFVLHQFPIGHMPVAAGHASRQLRPPHDDQAPNSCFPPQDHPRSDLVSDADALTRVRSGEARPERIDGGQWAPEELTSGHDPLGELSELEWERAYVARPAPETSRRGAEHVWPPAARFPEGGVEPGEPIVLDPDTALDCFGDAEGRVLYAETASFAQRCLPPEYLKRAYRRYRVMRPLPVWRTAAAPWFCQPGGASRYRTTYPIADLTALGHLVELTKDREAAEAHTLRIDRDQVAEEITRDAPEGHVPQ